MLNAEISYKCHHFLLCIVPFLMYFVNNDRKINIVAEMWFFHYLKRLYEILRIHKSNRKITLKNAVLEYGYYWSFSYFITDEFTREVNYNWSNKLLIFIWVWSEIQNHICHLCLSYIIHVEGHPRHIPNVLWFNYFVAPNYTFEVLSWLSFTLISGSMFSMIFTVISTYRMYMDALCKRDSYRKVEYQYDHFVLFPDIRLIFNFLFSPLD